jgi:hypothetical protein
MKKGNFKPEGKPFKMVVASRGNYSYPVLNDEKLPSWDEESDCFDIYFDKLKKPVGLYKVTVQPMVDISFEDDEYEFNGAYYVLSDIELIYTAEMLEE